jgi:hypothetical protein
MTFKLRKASDWEFEETVEINTIEDLKRLQDRYRNADGGIWTGTLIVDFYLDLSGIREVPTITIYDSYIE